MPSDLYFMLNLVSFLSKITCKYLLQDDNWMISTKAKTIDIDKG